MNRAARPLFVATILVGSFLLFLVQPMVARMALPRLGGAPNVWNSAMLVYQALLLAGYAYAHALSRFAVRTQALIHLALFALAALTLPIALRALAPPAAGWEVLWVPLLLVLTVGPVFFLVAAQAPLMQRWFAADPQAGAPWALYAASNLGSFAGLIAYPLLLEPQLALRQQSATWGAGYAVLFVLVALCAGLRWRSADTLQAADSADVEQAPGWRRVLLWLALSAVPSGFMLSSTTHLTTDVFAMPLLWVIPLGLYLLSFVVAFADTRWPARAVTWATPVIVLAAGGLTMISRHSGTLTIGVASVALLFTVSVSLHARLYDTRPGASRLTFFYLIMALGGALGGAFTALLAPVLFDWTWEHPILVLAAAALVPLPEILRWRHMEDLGARSARTAALVMLGIAALSCGLLFGEAGAEGQPLHRIFLTVFVCAIGLLVMGWRWMFMGVLAMLMLAQGGWETIRETADGVRTRSYFGVYTVRDYPDNDLRLLVHGSTLHGQQYTDPVRRRQTSTYYGPGSGVGIALEEAPKLFARPARVGVVGLGTGTTACLRQPGQRWTFFEIDPAVLAFSRQGTFTYLRDCAPDARIRLGDARLALEAQPRGAFDVLVIDAFSSDAIPLHLMTRQAVQVYMDALSPDGILLVHISNRYIELQPVLAAIARDLGLEARLRNDNPYDRVTYTPSAWVALARTPQRLEELESRQPDRPWQDLDAAAPQSWTDDHASILPYIRWNSLLGSL